MQNLEFLSRKLDQIKSDINRTIAIREQALTDAITHIKADIITDLNACSRENKQLLQEVDNLKSSDADIIENLNAISANHTELKAYVDSISLSELETSDGNKLHADNIQKSLNTVDFNLRDILYKLDAITKKLNSVNNYVAANNFKTSNVKQAQLTEFALKSLTKVNSKVTAADLTSGTKIKNLFDNHIWVLNKVKSSDGLTQINWEDFGSDNICVATNDGIQGLVAGSQNKLKGYIDVNGVISINGLEEELNDLANSIISVNNTIGELKLAIDDKFSTIEERLSMLENNQKVEEV